jgi:hypothetical protein
METADGRRNMDGLIANTTDKGNGNIDLAGAHYLMKDI